MQRIGDLELDQDLKFQQREWRIERIGWFAMLLIIVGALSGLSGTGPLSATTAGDPTGALAVDYQRFIRHDGRTTLTMQVSGDRVVEGQVEIWLASDYLSAVEIQRISPEPQEVRAEGERMVYVFAADGSAESIDLSFSLRPQHIGRLSGEIGLPGGPATSFTQLSYP